MPVGAIVGVGSAVSGIAQANAAKKAAKVQQQAANQARQDMLPFAIPGQGAMASLARLYGINPETGEYSPDDAFNQASLAAFQRSPDYQFAFDEGTRALQAALGRSGQLRGGNAVREATQFGQGLASQQLGSYRGALAQLAGIGAGAAGGAGQAALQAGAAQASGIVGGANALTGVLGNIGNYALANYQQQQQQQFLTNLVRPSGYTGQVSASPVYTGSLPQVPGLSTTPGTVLPGGFF